MFQGKGWWTGWGEAHWPSLSRWHRHRGSAGSGRVGGAAGPFQAACWVRPWLNTGFGKKENRRALGGAGIQIHVAGARRLSGPVPTRGPAGFHGNPHTAGRAGGPLGSHLVQPQRGLQERAPCSRQHLAGRMWASSHGVSSRTRSTVSHSSPRPYWFPVAHRTVSKPSACTPNLTCSQLHLCLVPKPCSTASLGLRLCLEGLPKPHLSKSCSNTSLLQEAFPESLRLSSALAYLLS